MTINYVPQFVSPVIDGSPSTTAPIATIEIHPGYVAGRIYPTYIGTMTTAAIPAVDTLYFYPFPLYSRAVLTSGQVRVVTGGAGSSIKVGIWANSTASARPLGAPLIVDNTGVATTSSGVAVTPALAGTLDAGLYWVGVKATGTLPSCLSIPSGHSWCGYYTGLTSATAMASNGLSFVSTYADAMPTMAEGASYTLVSGSGIPILGLVT
jgi:hypothetical protein